MNQTTPTKLKKFEDAAQKENPRSPQRRETGLDFCHANMGGGGVMCVLLVKMDMSYLN